MQIPFYTDCEISEFSVKNDEIFPPSPEKCPFKDCSMPVKLEKHGYYKRFFISKKFFGVLYIRRYICPVVVMRLKLLLLHKILNLGYAQLME